MGLMIDLQPLAGPALVVGGGVVATRKVHSLVEAGFEVTVIAPQVSEEIRGLAGVRLAEREFADEDMDENCAAIFACTGSREVNERIGRLAREAHVPVVVADRKEESTFFSPAVIRVGELTVGVSTGGASPELARAIREKIVAAIGPAGEPGPDWAEVLQAAREAREERLARARAAKGE
jgi:siroheme synthase-like protein